MQLKQVKLAGFKSFASPVTICLDAHMVGIAGPNGCGKSNIVDAVRWVMGETSRHIRASGNEDVIFSGSRLRKPLGQASVELVFDNRDGYVGGQYANYDELSLRRTYARDHGSVYYINNTRCRRRDIMDIFLGTGLGVNSYAIIEQGMIARIVEAKPEEVRGYIEEAAGVSRYKQRRHETELKVRHTHDNLSRVLDIRDEVDKQIQHLDRQAQAAERYRVLQQEKRQSELQLKVLQLKRKKEECERSERRIAASDDKLATKQTMLKELLAADESQRQSCDEVNEQLHQAQAAVYRLDADMQVMSRDLSRHEEDSNRLGSDRQRLNEQIEKNKQSLRAEKQKVTTMEERGAATDKQIATTRQEITQLEAQRAGIEELIKKLSDTHEQDSGEVHVLSEHVSNAKSKIAFYEEEMVRLEQNRLDVISQQSGLGIDALQAQREDDQRLLEQQQQAAQAAQQHITQASKSLHDLRTTLHDTTEQRDACRVAIHEVQGRIASVETIYEAGLGHDTAPFLDWVQKSGLSRSDFISENIVVEPGWELAVEMVLGAFLEGLQVDAIDDYHSAIDHFQQGRLCLLEAPSTTKSPPHPSLADKVQGRSQLTPLLQTVRLADSSASALQQRQQLSSEESIITKDGVWMGRYWLRVQRPVDPEQLILRARRQLNSLRAQHEQLQTRDAQLADTIKQLNQQLATEETRRAAQQDQHANALSELAKLETRLSHHDELIQQKNHRHQELMGMLDKLRLKSEQLSTQRQQLQQQYSEARQKLADFHSKHDELTDTRSARQMEQEEIEKRLNSARKQLQQLEISRESNRFAMLAAKDAVTRLRTQQSQLAEQLQQLTTALTDIRAPLADSKKKMDELKQRRVTLQQQAAEFETTVASMQERIKQLHNQRATLEDEISEQRAAHEKINAQLEVNKARLHDLRQSLSELVNLAEQAEDSLIAELPADLTIPQCQKNIVSLQGKIDRLGPINLAALQEFSELKQRKDYLDSQCGDLQSALQTLNNAVKKIDQETKERFAATIEAINDKLTTTFPSLFDGGTAYLKLTDKDLLTAGVTIMSQPPGKRLSSIRLLSGGEKTLTAIAVVFAIFNLNPAPFCLLDEVDAPLDEHNLERFCRLLHSMSKNIQIIVITHNKISMENMNQLIGVTMQEAGVSRQVSINLAEAEGLVNA